jgi:drug/metabolite transporter (DMT)-like permease
MVKNSNRTGILAFLFLKEPYTKYDVLSSISSLIGCILILKP